MTAAAGDAVDMEAVYFLFPDPLERRGVSETGLNIRPFIRQETNPKSMQLVNWVRRMLDHLILQPHVLKWNEIL